ncbi:MAG: sulfite exporter TauE/SafE family protein [Fimbriimonadaceae bacterium]|nr:sulfite exporter TauE/SafE family protein [Fimbriimonadaceae bacterium]
MSLAQGLECLVIGAAGGLLAGLLGVGGGIIMVPMLMAFLKLDVRLATAQSLAIIMITSVSGSYAHHRAGRLQWTVVLICGLAAALLSPIGVNLAQRLPRETLLRVFAVLLIVTGLKYLLPIKPTSAAAEQATASAAPQAVPDDQPNGR